MKPEVYTSRTLNTEIRQEVKNILDNVLMILYQKTQKKFQLMNYERIIKTGNEYELNVFLFDPETYTTNHIMITAIKSSTNIHIKKIKSLNSSVITPRPCASIDAFNMSLCSKDDWQQAYLVNNKGISTRETKGTLEAGWISSYIDATQSGILREPYSTLRYGCK